jgi:hypothetical protein
MSDYHGDAVLLVGDREIEVQAHLHADRTGPLHEWGGYVEAEDEAEDFYDAMNSDNVRIRLNNGREGNVVPTNTTIGSLRMDLSGSGAIPFS